MVEVYTGATGLPNWTIYLAVVISGLAGATYAARRGFDVIGVLTLSVTTGLGGLLIRDILLARGPIVLRDSTFIWMAVVAAVLGFFFAGYIARFDRVLLAMEALAMGLLASVGADSALRAGLGTLSAIVVGTIVATAGSLLRDILGGDAPQLLRPGVFLGVIALSGSILYVLLESMISEPLISQIVVIAVVFAGRLVAVRLDLETRPAADLSDRVWSFWDRRKGAAP
ncbi:MAG: TRIC cation channel family protein [Candidatus Nanopelagicales bacterium]